MRGEGSQEASPDAEKGLGLLVELDANDAGGFRMGGRVDVLDPSSAYPLDPCRD